VWTETEAGARAGVDGTYPPVGYPAWSPRALAAAGLAAPDDASTTSVAVAIGIAPPPAQPVSASSTTAWSGALVAATCALGGPEQHTLTAAPRNVRAQKTMRSTATRPPTPPPTAATRRVCEPAVGAGDGAGEAASAGRWADVGVGAAVGAAVGGVAVEAGVDALVGNGVGVAAGGP
jgi:hypothetical protein